MHRSARTTLVFTSALAALGIAACQNAVHTPVNGSAHTGGTEGEGEGEGEQCTDFVPGPLSVRMLTRAEYDRTVRDLLGDLSEPAKRGFPSETVLIGYENDAAAHVATPLLVENQLHVAEDVAHRALLERRDLVVPCDVAALGEGTCGAVVVDFHGPRAFRRPLDADERARLLGVFDNALAQWGFDTAVELVLQTLLVSPQFLYRTDLGDAVGTDGDNVLASPYEMASRLSYLLWGSMPDAALFDAAASGALLDAAGVEEQARRMLADERAQESVASFFRQWLGLDKLDNVTKDATAYPEYVTAMNASWKAGAQAFVDGVVWGGTATLSELFTSEALYVDALTAPLYGVDPPAPGAQVGELVARLAPSGTRAGLITQPAMMALLSGADQSSPIRRGVWVREKLLCQPLDPPPPNVIINPPVADPTLTTRERFAAHTANEECRACHIMIDPIGFGFEGYDALGRFRTEENGKPIDATGELSYTSDPSIEGTFNGARELGQKLASSSDVKGCLLEQVFTYAIGRVPGAADSCTRDHLRAGFDENADMRELFIAIATSDAFRTVRGAQ